jgi:3-hydroxyisobutyrate dehydrogenase
MDVPIANINTLFNSWNPGAMLPARLAKITEGNFTSPSWELNMARKDTGLFLEEAQKGGAELTLIPAIAELMDDWIEKGFGNNDWTVIAKGAV